MLSESRKHAVLIMAHDNWYNLGKLISYFDSRFIDLYIHIDKKSDTFPEGSLRKIARESTVTFIPRRKINWGTSDQIFCEMELYKHAYAKGDYRYYHLISGADCPLVPLENFVRFFENKDLNYIVADEEPHFDIRLKLYHNLFNHSLLPRKFGSLMSKKAASLQIKLGVNRLNKIKKTYPLIRQGHNWCSLTGDAVKTILSQESAIKKMFRYTQCADEMYKQTILCNSGLSAKLAPVEIREIDWSDKGKHPKVYTSDDFSTLAHAASSGKLFARKFDDSVDRGVIDRVYTELCQMLPDTSPTPE